MKSNIDLIKTFPALFIMHLPNTMNFMAELHTLFFHSSQGHNNGENVGTTALMVGRICLAGWHRVKVSVNSGATAVAPVAPVDTSLTINL